MKRAYHDLMEQISVPSGLNDRVLQTIRQEAAGVGTRWKRTALRAAVCAACALALVLGTVRLAPRSAEEPGLPQLTYSFGLTAYAADIGETIVPNANGGLALRSGTGIWDPLQGYFTGCLFQVTGENLQKVTLSVDRGGLYRSETRKALSNDEVQTLWQAEENGELVCSVYGADEGAPMNADVMTALGSNITVDYDPSASYGFWVPPEELSTASDDMKQDTWDSIDTFDGVHLTVEATFLDGKTESRIYTLSTGRLRLDRYENGTWTVLPQLAGDEEAYVYGIYAVSEEESRWFQWPVEGSNTISLSNPFGARWNPGGQGKTVHNGIDIPAERGTPVLAAADGTVTETGFDT